MTMLTIESIPAINILSSPIYTVNVRREFILEFIHFILLPEIKFSTTTYCGIIIPSVSYQPQTHLSDIFRHFEDMI